MQRNPSPGMTSITVPCLRANLGCPLFIKRAFYYHLSPQEKASSTPCSSPEALPHPGQKTAAPTLPPTVCLVPPHRDRNPGCWCLIFPAHCTPSGCSLSPAAGCLPEPCYSAATHLEEPEDGDSSRAQYSPTAAFRSLVLVHDSLSFTPN